VNLFAALSRGRAWTGIRHPGSVRPATQPGSLYVRETSLRWPMLHRRWAVQDIQRGWKRLASGREAKGIATFPRTVGAMQPHYLYRSLSCWQRPRVEVGTRSDR
jgi:hypothetical protein